MKTLLSKLRQSLRRDGPARTAEKCLRRIRGLLLDSLGLSYLAARGSCRRELRAAFSGDYDRVILWRSGFGYRVPLVQRPQHMAEQLAALRCLVFYEAGRAADGVGTLRAVRPGLILFNFGNRPLRRQLWQALKEAGKPVFLQIYSTNWEMSLRMLKRELRQGARLLYEYVDAISPAISGTSRIPKAVADKYAYAMRRREVLVAVTADALWRDLLCRRGEENAALIPNGVDYAFYQQPGDAPEDPALRRIEALGLPVVCYFGAMASWLDYGLLRTIAAAGRYSVVLFGVKYDDSFDRNLHGEEHIHFLGPRDYSVLKYSAGRADVFILPFLINEVTRSTSPVKLFEYMAMHKPIVSTDLDECRKYSSVLIARDPGEFLQQLDTALRLRHDEAYLALLDREARENDWRERAASLVRLMDVAAE